MNAVAGKLLTLVLTLSLSLTFLQSNAQGILLYDSAMFDGIMRNWIMFEPTGYDGSEAHPLVLNLHGAGSSATEQVVYSQFNTVADTVGALVLLPNAIENFWNSGFDDPTGTLPDDVSFLTALIDMIKGTYNVDADRVYTMGMSNGGFMSYRLVCETVDIFAAMASVTGSMTEDVFNDCDLGASAGQAIPVLQIHGTADSTVIYEGTPGAVAAQEDVIAYWAARNNCPPVDAFNVPDINMSDGSTVDVQRYYFCDDYSEVIFYRITNGGHTWPGSFPVITLGNTNQDIQGEYEIWKFFSRHSRADQFTGLESETEALVSTTGPNPFTDQLVVDLKGSSLLGSELQVRLLDLSGKEVLAETQLLTGSQLTISSGLERLEAGIYLLEITSTTGGSVLTQKVVRQ